MRSSQNFGELIAILTSLFIMIVCWSMAEKYPFLYLIFIIIYPLLMIVPALKKRRLIRAEAARKGLTAEDLKNIRFTKYWHEIRQQGLWRYLIIEGAIFTGTILALTFGILAFLTLYINLYHPADSPSV